MDEAQNRLESLNKTSVLLLGLMLVGLIGYIDYVTGYEVGFSLFYLFPIVFVTWFADTLFGFVTATASAAVWMIADRLAGARYSSPYRYRYSNPYRYRYGYPRSSVSFSFGFGTPYYYRPYHYCAPVYAPRSVYVEPYSSYAEPEIDVTNLPPAGCYYYDPFCDERFSKRR